MKNLTKAEFEKKLSIVLSLWYFYFASMYVASNSLRLSIYPIAMIQKIMILDESDTNDGSIKEIGK